MSGMNGRRHEIENSAGILAEIGMDLQGPQTLGRGALEAHSAAYH